MKVLKKAPAALAMLAMIGGCAIGAEHGYVMAPDGANYTDKYVSYSIYDAKGKPFWLGGDAKPFTKGGATGGDCCALLPGPGQIIRVVWDEDTEGNASAEKNTHTKDVVVAGSPPLAKDAHNSLVVRFFERQQVEVEFISVPRADLDKGIPSPRLDRIFFGERVMRHMGD